MYMLWGRLSYNPNTPDEVFRNHMAVKYPSVSTDQLFSAWNKVSACIPKITELVQGSWRIDLNWWLEGCISRNGFRTIEQFSECKVAEGSSLCSISKSAADSCFGKKSSLQLAEELETDAKTALSLISKMKADADSEPGVAINNIKAMAYMTVYYAWKIRGATYLKANDKTNARNAMGNAWCWWMNYANIMDGMYTGMGMQRVQDLPDWHANDHLVLKEYTDLGGAGTPACTTK